MTTETQDTKQAEWISKLETEQQSLRKRVRLNFSGVAGGAALILVGTALPAAFAPVAVAAGIVLFQIAMIPSAHFLGRQLGLTDAIKDAISGDFLARAQRRAKEMKKPAVIGLAALAGLTAAWAIASFAAPTAALALCVAANIVAWPMLYLTGGYSAARIEQKIAEEKDEPSTSAAPVGLIEDGIALWKKIAKAFNASAKPDAEKNTAAPAPASAPDVTKTPPKP